MFLLSRGRIGFSELSASFVAQERKNVISFAP